MNKKQKRDADILAHGLNLMALYPGAANGWPWVLSTHHGEGNTVWNITGQDEYPVFSGSTKSGDRLEDMRLMASAPELLEACVWLLQQYQQERGLRAAANSIICTHARAVVAKAEGRS